MGPGPFTGLRVGIAFARTFAMAREIPCIGVVSLDAIAGTANALAEMVSDFYVITDARRKEIYLAKYQKDGQRISEPAVAKIDQVDFESLPVIEFGFPDPLALVKLASQSNSVRTQPLYLRKPDAVLPKLAELNYRAMNNFDLGAVLEIEKEIQQNTSLQSTEKTQLSKSRRGQGIFRTNLERIEKSCRLTGLDAKEHLVASHIKPWRDSTNFERLDGYNGLLLSPHIDRLFDKGYISFNDNGDLLISRLTNQDVLKKWRIDAIKNVGSFNEKQKSYLLYHREHIFKD